MTRKQFAIGFTILVLGLLSLISVVFQSNAQEFAVEPPSAWLEIDGCQIRFGWDDDNAVGVALVLTNIQTEETDVEFYRNNEGLNSFEMPVAEEYQDWLLAALIVRRPDGSTKLFRLNEEPCPMAEG